MTPQARARGVPALRTWTRFELALAGVLLATAAAGWVLTSAMSMPDMRAGILTGLQPVATMPGMTEPSTPIDPVLAGALFLVTWVVMMAAMMLPAIIPFTIGLDRLLAAHPHRRRRLAALTTGYLAVWGLAGVLALLVVNGFDTLAAGPTPTTTHVRVGGVVLLAAGAYQFTPLKRWCLVRCRSPLALVMQHGQRARTPRGALRTGLTHGGYCLGCCWALMLVLLAAGVMSLVWMAVIAALITVEKVLPHGEVLAYIIGALLLALGALLITAPGVLPMPGLMPGSEAAP